MKSFIVLLGMIFLLSGCAMGLSSKSACQVKGQGMCAPMSAIESWDEHGVLQQDPLFAPCTSGRCHV